jgi:ribonuclease E
MAAKKTTDEKTGETQVKATTGAWWKSAVTETEAPAAKETAPEKPKAGTEKKPAPAKSRSRKRPAAEVPAEATEPQQDDRCRERSRCRKTQAPARS